MEKTKWKDVTNTFNEERRHYQKIWRLAEPVFSHHLGPFNKTAPEVFNFFFKSSSIIQG